MRLISFLSSDRRSFGTYVDGILVDLPRLTADYEAAILKKSPLSFSNICDFFESGYGELSRLDDLIEFLKKRSEPEKYAVPPSFRLTAPVPRPPKVVALGRNYPLHAKESNMSVPEEPIIFCKTSSSVIGPGETILVPRDVGRVDHEVELGVVIGRRAKRVQAADAYNYVVGYTIVLDVSARDLQRADIEKRYPWYRSKNFDTFTPIGPWIVTADEFPPPIELEIELSVNGEVRQKANTRNMIFDIPTIIEFITRYITLEPGDIISTGTPEGIGPIRDGDRVVSHIEGIGEMVNSVQEV